MKFARPIPARFCLFGTNSGAQSGQTAGCAAAAITYAAGTKAGYGDNVWQDLPSTANLYGATVTYLVAIDNPANVPVEVDFYPQGDAVGGWTFGGYTTLIGNDLKSYSPSQGLKEVQLKVRDSTKSATYFYCASSTVRVAFQVRSTADVDLLHAGTVTVYLSKIIIDVR